MKYIHKPTEVEAIQFTGNVNELIDFCEGHLLYEVDVLSRTLDGNVATGYRNIRLLNGNGELEIRPHDYIIKGEKKGDFWVCASDVFEKSYEVKEGKVPLGITLGGYPGYRCPHCNATYGVGCLPEDKICEFCHKDMRVKE